jgi:16S rRNA (cytidine1402-2'-O)-methyltransferase
MEGFEPGLYLCATPIGNLEDITLRVLRLLEAAVLIAAEDTRKTRSLLTHFQIHKPLVSYHQHNWRQRSEELLDKAKEGPVAIVSDAGLPGISDPGAELVALAEEANVQITVLPGANAALAALVLSGLSTERFAFEGFLPRQQSKRRQLLAKLKAEERTMIFYEAPHRIVQTVEDLYQALGKRDVAVARELTKKYEQIWRGKLQDLSGSIGGEIPLRGEFVIVVAGNKTEQRWSKAEVEKAFMDLLDTGTSLKEVSRQLALESGWQRNELYELGLKLHS